METGRWQMRDQLLVGPSRPQAEERAYSNWLWMGCLGLSSVVSRLPAVLAMTAAAKNSEPRPRKICKHEMKERPYFSRISQALVAALVPACASLVRHPHKPLSSLFLLSAPVVCLFLISHLLRFSPPRVASSCEFKNFPEPVPPPAPQTLISLSNFHQGLICEPSPRPFFIFSITTGFFRVCASAVQHVSASVLPLTPDLRSSSHSSFNHSHPQPLSTRGRVLCPYSQLLHSTPLAMSSSSNNKGRSTPRVVCCAIPISRTAGKVLVITSRKRPDNWVCKSFVLSAPPLAHSTSFHSEFSMC